MPGEPAIHTYLCKSSLALIITSEFEMEIDHRYFEWSAAGSVFLRQRGIAISGPVARGCGIDFRHRLSWCIDCWQINSIGDTG